MARLFSKVHCANANSNGWGQISGEIRGAGISGGFLRVRVSAEQRDEEKGKGKREECTQKRGLLSLPLSAGRSKFPVRLLCEPLLYSVTV